MARIGNSYFGRMSGKIGNAVVGKWKDVEYVRSKGAFRKKSNSLKVEIQKAKFKLVSDFLRSIGKLVKITFREFTSKMSGRNLALKQIMRQAVMGTYPDLEIDYSRVEISGGYNVAISPGSATAQVPDLVHFTWKMLNLDISKADDKSILVAHCPSMGYSVYTLEGPSRSTEAATLDVSAFKGQEIHTWLAFISPEGETSRSVYTGKVTVL